jgi:hypothetical protein
MLQQLHISDGILKVIHLISDVSEQSDIHFASGGLMLNFHFSA